MDFISQRRYGYALSGTLIIVCLLFIFATLVPNAHMGLQFSIAYTGGTVWEIHFQDETPVVADVREVLTEQGLTGEVAITSSDDKDYVLIRTEPLLQEATVTEGSAAAAALASAQPSGSPAAGASASPATATASIVAESASPVAEPSASPAPTAAAVAVPVVTAMPGSLPTPDASISAEATTTASATAVPVVTAVPAANASSDASASPDTSASPDASASPAAGASAAPGASPGPSASPGVVASGGGDLPRIKIPTEGRLGELAVALQDRFGPIDEVRQENSVGPVVSQELIWQTLALVLFAALAIMIWVAYRFRDFRMGVTALVALLHDVIITVGAFAILGTFVGLQIDALYVTAMLTVIGFSVHDTIVVFDRIRENRHRYLGEPLGTIVNFSLVQTIGRSMTTSLTLILTLLALLVFGGEAIRAFTFALFVGVIAGTYSSLFVATPLFLDWHLWDDKRKAEHESTGKAETARA